MRTLSGIQPSGKLHIGNYFGYVRPNIEWHQKADVGMIMIADLHALTTMRDPALLKSNVDDLMLDLLSCGFNLEKTIIFRQSDIPEHAELMWILSTMTPMGLLERAVSYKEKVEKGIAASAGLFSYPVLQAADIVLYDIDKVPVGRDQQQHLEITRDIIIKFNNAYGQDVLVVPEGVIKDEVAVVPGVDGQKMSKSYGNTIPLFGPEKAVQKTIMSIVTDSKGVEDPKDPDTCAVFNIHKLFLSTSEAAVLAEKYRAGGMGYGDAKKLLFQTYMDYLAPLRQRREELQKKPEYLHDVIRDGAMKASKVAKATMERVRKSVGLA